MLDAFKKLLDIATALNGEKGCPWDLQQTFESLCPYVLEEAHEVVEAVDGGKDEEIIEELGDLLYVLIFYTKIAERQNRFSLTEVLDAIGEKLIRRHPHVFGDAANDMGTIKRNWERIKQEEKKERKSLLDGTPKTLPLLMRAQKVLRKMEESGLKRQASPVTEDRSEELAGKILALVADATAEEIEIEGAIRKALTDLEKAL